MKLYTHGPSPNCIKVMAVANYLGIALEAVEVEPHSGECRSPEFRAKNPNGLLPTLEDDGYFLWESNAIIVYLAHKAGSTELLPTDLKGQSELWRWMCWGMCHWAPAIRPLLFERMVQPMIHKQPTNQEAVVSAEAGFRPFAAILEQHLETRPYLLGEGLSLADFSLGAYLVYADLAGIPLADFPGIQSWYARLAALPAWQKSLPVMPATLS